jgi:hypothetical protein
MSTTKDNKDKDKKDNCVPKWYNPVLGQWACFAVDGYEYVDDP